MSILRPGHVCLLSVKIAVTFGTAASSSIDVGFGNLRFEDLSCELC
jgi:hypothetical protein